MRLAGAGAADEDAVALFDKELTSGEIAHETSWTELPTKAKSADAVHVTARP